jgi:hypothetical protein
MSEVRLVVREAGHDWSGVIHGSSADRAIAALSADPVTLAELEAACARFAKPTTDPRFLASLLPGLHDEPYDAGLVLIDLVARLVVVDSTYSSAGPTGEVSYHDGQTNTDRWLRYHLAEDWLFTSDPCQWQGLSDKRRRERTTPPLLDTREVFYGRPLLEFIARETFAAFARRMTIGPSQPENLSSDPQRTVEEFSYDALREIHAAWLLTPREDLGGVCPRDVALERRAHLEWDLQDQCERWSLLGQCPPGLDKSSLAFRYGGFGTHELVEYYSLVRALLWSCWRRLVESRETQAAATRPEALTVGDFLTSEIPRLESVRDQWLDTPDPECHGRTPCSIIERERARLPRHPDARSTRKDPVQPTADRRQRLPNDLLRDDMGERQIVVLKKLTSHKVHLLVERGWARTAHPGGLLAGGPRRAGAAVMRLPVAPFRARRWRCVFEDIDHEATRIPGRSSPAGRSPAPHRPPSGHTDPPGSTRPSSPDAGSGGPATPPFSAPVPNPRGRCQST